MKDFRTVPASRVPLFAALALALGAGTGVATQEIELDWEAAIESSVEIPGESMEVRGRGGVVATASVVDDGTRLELRVFDADGDELWIKSLDFDFQAPFEDLELSEDGSTLFVLFQRNNQAEWLRLVAYDAGTGVEQWSRNFAGDPSLAFLSGQLEVAGGRVAVLVSDHDNSLVWQSRVLTLAASDGSELSTSATFPLVFPSVYLAPSGQTAYVWTRPGEMVQLNPTTGATGWSVVVPTTPTPIVLGSGVTALALDGSESVLARTDGAATVGFDAATGAQIWSQPAVEPRDLAAYAEDRFFVCGQQGLGSTATGSIHEYGMLDAATGAVLWNGTQQSLSISSSALFLQTTQAAVDPARNRVAYRDKGLFVFDATTGAAVGSGVFASFGGSGNPLSVLDDGTWVSSNNTLSFAEGRLVEAFGSDGQFLWVVKAADAEVAPTRPVWIEARASGTRVHVLWEYDPLLPLWPSNGQWEVRSSTNGSILSAWPWPSPLWSPTTKFDLDPTGQRLATARSTGGAPSSVRIQTFDALDGDSLELVQLNGGFFGNECDIAWAPGGNRFAVGWRDTSGFRVGGFSADGQMNWLVNVPVPGATNLGRPLLAFDAATGDVLAAMEYRAGGDQALSVTRLAAASGASLGHLVWDGDGPVSAIVDHAVLAMHSDAVTARTYAVVQVGTLPSTDTVWAIAIDATAMVVTAERVVAPQGGSILYGAAGSALTPDSSALVLAGRGPLATGLPLTQSELWIDALELPDLTPRFQSKRAAGPQVGGAQVQMLSSEVGVVRYSWGPGNPQPNVRLELFDLTDGDSLEQVAAEQGLLLNSFAAVADNRVIVAGKTFPEPTVTRLQAFQVAPLLSAPHTLPTAGGSVDFVIDAGSERAGDPYLLVGSTSGTEPATPVGGVSVPLVVDGYTSLLLAASNMGPFVGTHGLLSTEGTGRARIDLPNLPSLLGVEFHHAAVVLGASGAVDFVTQPVGLLVQD